MITKMLVIQDKYQANLKKLLDVCRKNLKNFNEDLITRAFWFSYNAHKDNYRASGEPYFNHPYEVAMIVANEIPLDDISVASALLHDIVEDTSFTIEDIQAEFGDFLNIKEEGSQRKRLKFTLHLHIDLGLLK